MTRKEEEKKKRRKEEKKKRRKEEKKTWKSCPEVDGHTAKHLNQERVLALPLSYLSALHKSICHCCCLEAKSKRTNKRC